MHLRRSRDVVILLLTNTYVTMFLFSLLVVLINVKVIQADLYGFVGLNDSDLITCQVEGFLIFVTFGLCYISFLMQAFYRFARVIYPKHRFLQTFSFNLISIGVTWALYTLILLPSYFWPGGFLYALYPYDYYCGIPYEKTAGLLYTAFIVYVVPVICFSLLYARLVYYIRYQTQHAAQTGHARRSQRDFLVIRRILFTVNILTLPGLPNAVLCALTSTYPSLSGFYYMYRIQWVGAAVAFAMLSIALLIMTPQLKKIATEKLFGNRNRVMPADRLPVSTLTQTRFDR